MKDGIETYQHLLQRRRLTRRSLLQGAGALALAAPFAGALVACGSDSDDETPTTTSANSTTATASIPKGIPESAAVGATPSGTTAATGAMVSFTDDLAKTVSLPAKDARVVAYVPIAAGLWDFGVHPVGIFGTPLRADGTRELYTGNIDLDATVSVGDTYGEIDLEKLIELKPDLIVTDLWGPEFDLFGLEGDDVARVESIAPIVSIGFISRPVTETIGSLERLAIALGTKADDPDIVAAHQQFDAASDELRGVIADKPGLTTLVVAAWPEGLYVADPERWADLIYFHELGLEFVRGNPKPGELWEILSWEQAMKYTADLVLNDARSGALTPDDLANQPTWAQTPAQQAGQIGKWATEYVPSYQGFTTLLNDLAETIRQSRADVV